MRKAGRLDEALTLARESFASTPEDLYLQRAYDWVLYDLVKREGQAFEGGTLHPFAWWYTFATDLLTKTRNLRMVQKAMGHESIATTEIYLHVQDEEMEAALKGLRNGE